MTRDDGGERRETPGHGHDPTQPPAPPADLIRPTVREPGRTPSGQAWTSCRQTVSHVVACFAKGSDLELVVGNLAAIIVRAPGRLIDDPSGRTERGAVQSVTIMISSYIIVSSG